MSQSDGSTGRGAGSRIERLATGAALVCLVALIVATGGIWRPTSWSSPATSASLFPMLILAGLGFCGVLIALGADREETDRYSARSLLQMGAALGGVAGYALLLPVIGWVPASALFLTLMPLLLGYRHAARLAFFVAVTTALGWLVFGALVQIPLRAFP